MRGFSVGIKSNDSSEMIGLNIPLACGVSAPGLRVLQRPRSEHCLELGLGD